MLISVSLFCMFGSFAIGRIVGQKIGRSKGYDQGYNAGLIEGSKDTPFHVRRVRADANSSIKLARKVTASFIDQLRGEILSELDECANRYHDKEQVNHGA